ncbi:hypothetical protein GCM10023321_09330 [Pseudonocardia eucalypti]|uniref:Cytochrome bc1 complex Rieske iron-sulfur subunit n=1 Tax=Pseudonocardia eucalypti TaxID=648755 RepID=A0ABP9PLU2_9PSEU|nr:nitrite reductase/ring-hydroxylating ferredoxin subunit [Pseudonocardia eucalypti]
MSEGNAAPPNTAPRLNRRGALAAGGAATAAAALVATGCSTYSPAPAPAPAPTPAEPATGGQAASGAPQAAAPGNPPAAQPSGIDLGPASAVPVGGGKVFSAQRVVVTQPAAGTFKAFSATCTHQGCTVGSVSGGNIICPCHGSEFSATDGSVTNGPAKRPLAARPVSAEGGQLRLS